MEKNLNQEIDPIVLRTWAHWVMGSDVIPDQNGGFTLNWFKYEEIEYKFLFMAKGGKSYLFRASECIQEYSYLYLNNQKKWYEFDSVLAWKLAQFLGNSKRGELRGTAMLL